MNELQASGVCANLAVMIHMAKIAQALQQEDGCNALLDDISQAADGIKAAMTKDADPDHKLIATALLPYAQQVGDYVKMGRAINAKPYDILDGFVALAINLLSEVRLNNLPKADQDAIWAKFGAIIEDSKRVWSMTDRDIAQNFLLANLASRLDKERAKTDADSAAADKAYAIITGSTARLIKTQLLANKNPAEVFASVCNILDTRQIYQFPPENADAPAIPNFKAQFATPGANSTLH